MNKILLVILGISLTYSVTSQDESKYMRSSLSMVMLESESFPDKENVMKSWNNYPFPDKYNKHNIELKSINIETMKLTDEDLKAAGYLVKLNPMQFIKATSVMSATGAQTIRYTNKEQTEGLSLPGPKVTKQLKLEKVLKEKKVANQIVKEWFGMDDGEVDMNLISERGTYNASEMDVDIAAGQASGNASLRDAGVQLISNTFTTFTSLDFRENEPVARAIRDAAKASIAENMVGKPQILIDKANQVVDKVYDKTKEGYSLWSKTWLFKLNWNDTTWQMFNLLYDDGKVFDNDTLFKLDFVGAQYNQSLVTFKLKGPKRSKEELIDIALVRNVDKAFAKLQKKNDVFKPRVPVISNEPLRAQIGTKEGLKGGEKFEVLERVLNKEGFTEYKVVGKVKVDKKQPVWDNTYNPVTEEAKEQKDNDGNVLNATIFKGSKKIQPGMLLKQLK